MKDQKEIQKALENFRLPRYEEIPDVGLYLEQVVKFINGCLTEFPDMALTPSMITNYVKQKVVPRVSRKTYSRDQIAMFMYVAMAKNVLSIQNIRTQLEPYHEGSFKDFYTEFCEDLDREIHREKNSETLLSHVAAAVCSKMVLEQWFREDEKTEE